LPAKSSVWQQPHLQKLWKKLLTLWNLGPIKEHNMTETENEIAYAKWVLADSARQLAHAAVIYGVALSAYWTFVG
jgi:hypothetical protein